MTVLTFGRIFGKLHYSQQWLIRVPNSFSAIDLNRPRWRVKPQTCIKKVNGVRFNFRLISVADCWRHFRTCTTYTVASYSSSLPKYNTRQLLYDGGGEPWGLRLLKECIVLHVVLKWTLFGILWHLTDIAFVLANWFDFLRIYVYLVTLTLVSRWLIFYRLYSTFL